MKPDILENYVEKVYGYAVNRTSSREEADELAQEILFTAVRELPKLQQEDRLEPWIWGIARNVTKSFRRYLGKQRAMYSYDMLEKLPYEEERFDDPGEVYELLRREIAMLSARYRDIIVLYYYDGLSTKTISERLDIPEGTVRWRLTEARRKLKKECANMQETALRPVKLGLDIYGRGNYNGDTVPFPTAFIDDALSQNILYNCYEQPRGIEDLAKLCGVPAYYIEERIENLRKREALVKAPKGKYRTDFIIWSDKHGLYCEQNAERMLLPMLDELVGALKGIAEEAADIGFYKAGKREADLFYLYGAMAFSYASEHYCTLPDPQLRKKYDGGEWCYVGTVETGKHPRITVGRLHSANLGSRGGCSHTVYYSIDAIAYRNMMGDSHINVCEDILRDGGTEDIVSAAEAIRKGYIVRKRDGSLFVTVPFFTKAQKAAFDAIAEKYLAPLMPAYSEIIGAFVSGYKRLFPRHLHEDADRMCRYMFFGAYSVVIRYAQRTGAIEMPSPNCTCDVMLQFKEV